jgi:hypothetical protein
MSYQDDDPISRAKYLEWLATRGMCDPKSAAEYVGRKLLNQELFMCACQEFERATASRAYADHSDKFTIHKPDEYPLLEIWYRGFGPNDSFAVLVASPPRPSKAKPNSLGNKPSLVVRYGYPAVFGVEMLEARYSEGSIGREDFEALLEPLRHIQVPPLPGEETLVIDGGIIGFEIALGYRRFSCQWHTIPPAGWEPLADWLGDAIDQLRQLTQTSYEH